MSSPRLTDEQLASYHGDGYVILDSVFDADEVRRMSDEADRILQLCINASLAQGRRDRRLDCYAIDGHLMVRKLQPVIDLSDYLAEVSNDERLIAPQRQIMDAEPLLMEEKLNYKQPVFDPVDVERLNVRPGDDRFFLHHDWGYYRKQGYPQQTMSSAITIDACTSDNGPLRVIPGTHKQTYRLDDENAQTGSGVLAPGQLDDAERVEVLCGAGSVLLFSSMLVHDSMPNTTRRPRRLMIYSHYPAWHDAEPDKRNGPGRREAQTFEAEYLQGLDSGKYQAEFELTGATA